jgi:phosphatidylglycerophosphate synthase
MALLYIALALTIWSGLDYFLKFYREYDAREGGADL